MKKSLILLTVTALLAFVMCAAASAGPSLKVESLRFESAAEDLVGRRGGASDGTKDAVFSLTVSGAQAIQSITLRNETTGEEWNTSDGRRLLLLKNSKGETVNAGGRMTPLPILLVARLSLIVNDAEAAVPKNSDFTATVTMIGGETASASAQVPAVRPAKRPGGGRPSGGAAEITLVEFKGRSKQDFVGDKERAASNGKKDFRIDTRFKLPKGVSVEGVKVSAENGGRIAEWDTARGNGAPLVIVTDNSNNIQNKQNGSLSLSGGNKYRLFVDGGNGILGKAGTKITVTATLSNGRIIEAASEAAASSDDEEGGADVSARYMGRGKFDFAGNNEKPAANMNADSFIAISVTGSGAAVTGISVTNDKNGKTWDTVPGNGNPAAVVLTNEKSPKKLCAADGSISIPANKAGNLLVAFDEKQGKNTGPYKVTVLFEDGRIAEAMAKQAR